METRYKLKFPSREAMQAAQAMEAATGDVALINEKRNIMALEARPTTKADTRMFLSTASETPDLYSLLNDSVVDQAVEQVVKDADVLAAEFGARRVVDTHYDLEEEFEPDFLLTEAELTAEGSLDDVVEMTGAVRAWERSRGAGVTIAVVDTGVSGARPEFPQSKRIGDWQPPGEQPWTDWQGHGSMCACISAGTKADGGVFDGIAPDAGLIACRTHFYDSELTAVYDMLIARAEKDEVIVATNSFGRRTGTPPTLNPDDDFPDALNEAVEAGVHVFFSAGNNHELAGGAPNACDPNSVWLYKSRDSVAAVATCDLGQGMWYYSSRGPGQHFGDPGTNRKPDVTAPTPRNGEVVYGDDLRVLPNGWGTSGACPQAAGLAALLLAIDRTLAPADVYDLIRDSARDIGFGPHCQGEGMIDCEAAVRRLLTV